jgi:predicted DNA-binding antitoxin AbrB/MazE fold protein
MPLQIDAVYEKGVQRPSTLDLKEHVLVSVIQDDSLPILLAVEHIEKIKKEPRMSRSFGDGSPTFTGP